jgi:serine/threonine protein kinase
MELNHIGRYDIKSLIGQGGMSAVYLGYDPRSLREVAIKILPPYYLHAPKFRERFDREALTIALLEHPAIVPVYDMGEEDGQPYIVMRYMSGGSLAEKLKKGPIPLRECLDMYIRLAPALDTAHARGIIHRDVKPDNLLFDKYDNIFLSDFGLARLRETIGFANISDGSILGTPAYMSPEQIQGDHEIDGRSDIYSMGVVLYHMLCGSVPFSGATAASVMMMHLINPVPQIHEQNKSLPIAIQTVLDTAMAKNPKDRYQTVGEFAKAIQAVTTGVHKKLPLQNAANTPAKQPTKQSSVVLPTKKPVASTRQSGVAPAKPAQSNGNKPPTALETSKDGAAISNRVDTVSPKLERTITSSLSHPYPLQQKRFPIPQWVWVFSVVIILSLSLTVIQWFRGGFPFSLLTGTSINPESTPSPIILGQADKLAFLNGSNIWVSNLDGTDLEQLTTDGVNKSHLHWSPEGNSVIYTSDNCLNSVDLESKQVLNLTCFLGTSINSFDISPDGQNAALGLGQSDLYLLPYQQLFHLRQTSIPEDLLSLAQCSYYSPYHVEDTLKAINWSLTNEQLALLVSKVADGVSRDEINILDFSQCSPTPLQVKDILPTYFLFTLRGYYHHPEISGFSWNDDNQLLMNGYLNNGGFGDLQLYDLDKNQSQEVAPNGSCCYRDTYWSPDGTYLFYTFQPEDGGDIRLYYAPYSELDQPDGAITSLALPIGFFAGNLEPLQPALRTAH